MKTCSKCKRDLDESFFVKSGRYLDGLYPSCKECRKSSLLETLKNNPMCSKCKSAPHQPSNMYCYQCGRDAKGYSKPAKWRRDHTNDYWCSQCKKEPRVPYHNYCIFCKRKYLNEWFKKRRGVKLPKETKKKQAARRFIYSLYQQGKIVREQCCMCDNESIHFHHMDYEYRTLNVLHLCLKCHVAVTKSKRILDKVFEQELRIHQSLI